MHRFEFEQFDIRRISGEYDTVIGRVRHATLVLLLHLSETPQLPERLSLPMGTHPPSWPPRQ